MSLFVYSWIPSPCLTIEKRHYRSRAAQNFRNATSLRANYARRRGASLYIHTRAERKKGKKRRRTGGGNISREAVIFEGYTYISRPAAHCQEAEWISGLTRPVTCCVYYNIPQPLFTRGGIKAEEIIFIFIDTLFRDRWSRMSRAGVLMLPCDAVITFHGVCMCVCDGR